MSLRDDISWELVKDAQSIHALDDGESWNDVIDAVLRAILSANYVVVEAEHYAGLVEAEANRPNQNERNFR